MSDENDEDDVKAISALVAARRAIAEGVDVRGYIAWPFLDNFEWHVGYSRRYGMIYVDYATQRRLWKTSAHWYREIIANHGGGSAKATSRVR
jgi:beta-glucosidase